MVRLGVALGLWFRMTSEVENSSWVLAGTNGSCGLMVRSR